MDELLQLRGFLRRQRHADSGSSRPPHTLQPRSPSSRTHSISSGRSTKRRGGAVASDPSGREPGCRGGTTNCFQTVPADSRRGCPQSCLIGAVHRAAFSGIPSTTTSRGRHVFGRRSPTYAPESAARRALKASFRAAIRQSAGRPKDPGRSRAPPSALRRSFPGQCSSFSPAGSSHVHSLRGVDPRPNELHTPDGES